MGLQNVEWFQVKSEADLSALEKKLPAIAPYDGFTEGKHDKNDKPICFVGNQPPNDSRVNPHFAVWCKTEALMQQALLIIDRFAQPQV